MWECFPKTGQMDRDKSIIEMAIITKEPSLTVSSMVMGCWKMKEKELTKGSLKMTKSVDLESWAPRADKHMSATSKMIFGMAMDKFIYRSVVTIRVISWMIKLQKKA